MYTRQDIVRDIMGIGIKPMDTLLVHSSMKAIGEVDGGADTVLDAFMEYMKDGLLIFPTHTWDRMSDKYRVFHVATEPSCVGLLTNLFLKREGVIRSWHPTHSVAAYGKDAKDYVSGEEFSDTPCSRTGCWGKLYDRRAKILFLGCSPKKNTYLHGVEERNQIENRLTEYYNLYQIMTPEGELIDRPMRGHHNPIGDISQNYDKMMAPFLHHGIAKEGQIGDAKCYLCDAAGMAELTSSYLQRDPDLFLTGDPIPEEWL
jgi:aminoglycoside 3-N-acetyltransferase